MADQSKQADSTNSPEGGGEQAAPADVRQMSFEDALAELKQIVERLEKGEGKLDEAIQAYERGAHLKRHCEQKLKEAEAKIEKVRVSGGGFGGGSDGSGGEVATEPLDVE